MEFVTLGRTNLMVSRSGLSTRRLEQLSAQGITAILDVAYQAGINLYEFSCQAMDCSPDAGSFFYDKRKNVVISVTTELTENLNISSKIDSALGSLYMDHIDIFSIKSDEKFYGENDFLNSTTEPIYRKLQEAKSQGKIGFIGFYTHDLQIAKKVVESKLYDVIHFPLNIHSSDEELDLVRLCHKNDIGMIARMPLDGGKIDNVPLAFGYLKQFESVVPLYNAQNLDEVQKLIYFEENPPVTDSAFNEEVLQIRSDCL